MPNDYHIDARLYRQQAGVNRFKWVITCPMLRLEVEDENLKMCAMKFDLSLTNIFGSQNHIVVNLV